IAAKVASRLREAHRVLSNPDLRLAHDELLASDDAPEFAAPAAEEHGVVPGSLGRLQAVSEGSIDVSTNEFVAVTDDDARDAMSPPDPRTLTDVERPPSSDGPQSRRRG
ncbi:MAG: hypothetical protein ACHREM_30565, partial [Polyangiales bacterium]